MPCNHCFHLFTGPIWQVLRDGHVVEKCCRCDATRTIHRDHRHERFHDTGPGRNNTV